MDAGEMGLVPTSGYPLLPGRFPHLGWGPGGKGIVRGHAAGPRPALPTLPPNPPNDPPLGCRPGVRAIVRGHAHPHALPTV